MSLSRQVMFWFAALAVFVVLLWLLHGVMLPFVAGMVLAYLLDPLANRIERYGVGRALATVVIVGLFILIVVLLVVTLAPVVISQTLSFIDKTPGYLTRLQELVAESNQQWLNKLLGDSLSTAEISTWVKQSTGGFTIFVRSLWSGGQAVISIFSLLVITPVVAFYLLNDWNRMVGALDSWLPRNQADTIRGLAREINTAIAGFMRGQSAVCLILGSFYAVGFSLIGLNFGLLIGLVSGILCFIPYVGTLTALVVSVGVAVAQFWPEWTPLILVLVINGIGQVLEGYVLAPYLVGPSVGLHPVWLMFALFSFGYLFGFVGLLVAIPLAAAVGVLVRFGLRQYLASAFYTGNSGGNVG